MSAKTPWQEAQSHMKARANELDAGDNPYAAFALIREEARNIARPPKPRTLAEEFLGANHMDYQGNTYRRVAMAIYLSENYNAEQVVTIRDLIERHAANRSLEEDIIIQSTSPPYKGNDDIWRIDMIASTDLDYNKANALHRQIAEETEQKTDDSLFADEEKLIDWVVRRQIASRLEQALAKHGYDDLVLDVESLRSTELRLSTENVEPTSQTGSSMNFVL